MPVIDARQKVEMDFGAGTAGAGVAHHPEVVFFVSVNDVEFGIESFRAEDFGPDVVSFLIEFSGVTFGFIG